MIEPIQTKLLFQPLNLIVEARICDLTPPMVDLEMTRRWWDDEALDLRTGPQPIDRYWSWNEVCIERNGRVLASDKVALVTDDAAVQGAMLISTEAVESSLRLAERALFVELLFTAPRNRPALRRDKQQFFVGVGKVLLAWGAMVSRQLGYDGRLRLDGSPDFVAWYENRGLQILAEHPIVFEGTSYTPMELSAPAAASLIDSVPLSPLPKGAKP